MINRIKSELLPVKHTVKSNKNFSASSDLLWVTGSLFMLPMYSCSASPSVSKRPDCAVPGHWEVDTVVSGQGKSKACFATFAERKTRYYIAVKMPDRKAATMAKTIIQTLSEFPSELVKTIF